MHTYTAQTTHVTRQHRQPINTYRWTWKIQFVQDYHTWEWAATAAASTHLAAVNCKKAGWVTVQQVPVGFAAVHVKMHGKCTAKEQWCTDGNGSMQLICRQERRMVRLGRQAVEA